jgi:excinuclease ABC subunit A
MYQDKLVIRGAQQHNLKNIDLTIPRHKLVVITGVSGSGKSSLAFDTLYAEGQRRYVESLSSYARQFLGQMEKPKVDFIGGLSPAIAIEQKAVSKNPRSTVGTVTEIYDYLRVLYARIGTPHCPQCGREVHAQSAQQIVDQIAQLPAGTRFQVLAPVVRGRKGTHEDTLNQARADGYVRARVDGVPVELSDRIKLAKTKKHDIEIVVDRLVIPHPDPQSTNLPDTDGDWDPRFADSGSGEFTARLTDSAETALELAEGLLYVDVQDGEMLTFSEENACPVCGISFPELTPQMFSFNSPFGMCPDCNGLGTQLNVDPTLIVRDPSLSLMDGALRWYGDLRKKQDSWTLRQLRAITRHYGVDLETPWQDQPQSFRDVLFYGSGEEKIHFEFQHESENGTWSGETVRPIRGIIFHINRLFHQTKSDYTRRWYASFMSDQPCPTCGGKRLRLEAAGVTLAGKRIQELTSLSICDALTWVESLWPNEQTSKSATNAGCSDDEISNTQYPLTEQQFQIAEEVLKEIRDRLQFMLNVGLHYLTLDRSAPSLSGGEGQRIRLASQIGCGLVGVLYILDEPSIGLHQRDNRRLLDTLEQLRDMGNTVLVVEHDAETMLTSDWIVDLGPGAGVLGGWVVSQGTPEQIARDPRSLTGRYLSGEMVVASPNGRRRPANGKWLTIIGARQNNLHDLTVRFPAGLFTCVTGVSGSGKSSLISQTLHPALSKVLHRSQQQPGDFDRLEGLEESGVDKVINITQDPIGRTPRSNPATYVGVFNDIRDIFAQVAEAKARGYKQGRFSFNVKGGRCEACKGHGQKVIEMHFLADVWVRCDVCKGSRYNRETLQIRYKGRNIAETLDMDVNEALEHFANIPKIQRKLQTLADVGLGYIKLGQSATTLSGGEAQRVKLAKELSRVSTGDTVYILDEPTTGLHFADIQKLLDVLHRLTDAGNTVIVIEHNLDVIKTADWIVDLGPEGGDNGGQIVAQGTPEQVAGVAESYTGQFLKHTLSDMKAKSWSEN